MLWVLQEVQLKPIIMAVRRKLVSELRKTGSLLFNESGQRRDATAAADALGTDLEGISEAKPYSAVPGPREAPVIGNAWRFLPYIGEQPVVSASGNLKDETC
jgi:hypothetical protein